MKKKLVLGLTSILLVIACALGFAACSETGEDSGETQEHNWGAWEIVTEATCTETGSRRRVCLDCGEVQTEEIPKTDHNFGEDNKCRVCGYELEFTTGLEYEEFETRVNGVYQTCYAVTSMGMATDRDIVIPAYHAGARVYKISESAFRGKDVITSLYIANGVYQIEASAFEYCAGLEKVTLPESMEAIAKNAFYGCQKLSAISMPSGGVTIGVDVFSGTAYYSDQNHWENGVLMIGNHLIATNDAFSASSYTLPDGVVSIAASAFNGRRSLTELTIAKGHSLEEVGSNAFANTGITKATVPTTCLSDLPQSQITDLTVWGGASRYSAFTSLRKLSLESVSSFYSGGLSGLGSLEELTLPYIGFYQRYNSSASYYSATGRPLGYLFGTEAYSGGVEITQSYYTSSSSSNRNEETYYIPASLRSVTVTEDVGAYALNGCYMIESVTLPETATSIATAAFYNCTGLTSITIPESVTSIGNGAFQGCSGLTSITIPDGVTSIGNWAFYNCSGLTSIVVEEDNEVYHSGGNCLIETASKTLIAGCKNSIIPSDGSVTSIGSYSFYNCSGLTRITIPNSVTSIGNSAFSGCSGLISVTIGNGVTSIGSSAFNGCSGLTSIAIPDSVTSIDSWAFLECSGLTGELVIPDSVTSIGAWAFGHCSGLTSVIIGNGVTSIGNDAFTDTNYYNDSSNWENGVLYIGKYLIDAKTTISGTYTIKAGTLVIATSAFLDCRGLTEITIPDSVTSIESSVFSRCSGLTSVTIGNGVTNIGSSAFYNCSGLTSITIPDSVTSIGSSAFSGCSGLTSITIPDSVTSIGDSAFSGCSGLTSITIPDSVTSIGDSAFRYCSGLTEINYNATECANLSSDTSVFSHAGQSGDGITVNIGANVKSIPECLFYSSYAMYSPKIVSVVFAENSVCTFIGDDAFYNCSELTGIYITDIAAWCRISFNNSAANPLYYAKNLYLNGTLVERDLVIPDGVTSIGNYAFFGCSGLTSITIPDSVTSIGSSAFYGCSGLTSVTIPDSVTSIGSYAFYNCSGLTSVAIPDSVTSIGSSAFEGCSGLTNVTIPNSVTSIGSSAFRSCSGLTSVTIPDSVTSIGSSAFSGCSGLTSVTIPDSVTSIGSSAFRSCSGLTSVTIGNGVTSIGDEAFSYCSRLEEIYYNAATVSDLTSSSDVFYHAGSSADGIAVTFGDGVQTIPAYLFYVNQSSYQPNITSVTIGNGVTNIGAWAFGHCSSLTSVTIGNDVTSIGSSAFYGCSGLTSVTIPDSVTSIGNDAFYGCSGLTSVTIPDSVTSIGSYAFYNCSGLTNVTFENPNGWKYSESSDATNGTSISSADLFSPSTAATYLKSTYYYYYWKRG